MAFGQSGSSHIGPFPSPLDFIVTVNGIDSEWDNQYGNTIEGFRQQFEWSMNPADSGYRISGDTITYNSQSGTLPSGLYSYWINLVFDSLNKTISNVSFGNQQIFQVDYVGGGVEDNSLIDTVWLANFTYDSSSIYTTDSTLLFHHANAYY